MQRYLTAILLIILIVAGMFGASCTRSPDVYQTALNDLAAGEARLGEMNSEGEFYTLREFGYDIAELTKPIPDDMISEEYGFSKLVIFYKYAEKSWEEYNRLPLDMESTVALAAEELYGSDAYLLAGVLWFQYDELPNKPTSVRTEYRLNHPEVDALLLFWGKSTRSVFYRGTPEWKEVESLLNTWSSYYGITRAMQPGADWTLLQKS